MKGLHKRTCGCTGHLRCMQRPDWVICTLLQDFRLRLLPDDHAACIACNCAAVSAELQLLHALTSASAGAAETRGLATATVPGRHQSICKNTSVTRVRQCAVAVCGCSSAPISSMSRREAPSDWLAWHTTRRCTRTARAGAAGAEARTACEPRVRSIPGDQIRVCPEMPRR